MRGPDPRLLTRTVGASSRPDSVPRMEIYGYKIEPGADLAWAKLAGADLSGAKLAGADLSTADLTDVIGLD